MIIESVGIVAPPQKREELRRALSSLVGPTEVEPGCVSCRLYQESADANTFLFESQWKTKDDLVRHMRSDLYRAFLGLMEMSAEPPTIEFHAVSETRGLDFIHTIRQEQT